MSETTIYIIPVAGPSASDQRYTVRFRRCDLHLFRNRQRGLGSVQLYRVPQQSSQVTGRRVPQQISPPPQLVGRQATAGRALAWRRRHDAGQLKYMHMRTCDMHGRARAHVVHMHTCIHVHFPFRFTVFISGATLRNLLFGKKNKVKRQASPQRRTASRLTLGRVGVPP